MNYCSPIDKRIINNRPITGVHIGYSGQVGFAAEGGAYYQTDWLMDWVGGDLYTTRTIGAFGYGGTPTAMNGQIYAGLSGVKGIPWYYSQKSVSDALEGPQIDVAGALGIETIAVLDLGYSRSQDIDENGVYIESNGYKMYSNSLDIMFGIDTFPNLVDAGFQGGLSRTFVVNVISLW